MEGSVAQQCKSGAGLVRLRPQMPSAACFCQGHFLGTYHARPFMCRPWPLSCCRHGAAWLRQTLRPTEPEIFTVCSFTTEVCLAQATRYETSSSAQDSAVSFGNPKLQKCLYLPEKKGSSFMNRAILPFLFFLGSFLPLLSILTPFTCSSCQKMPLVPPNPRTPGTGLGAGEPQLVSAPY